MNTRKVEQRKVERMMSGMKQTDAAPQGMSATVDAAATPRGVAVTWTLERGVYVLALLVGGWLRFWALGRPPLSGWEAANSWPAWLAAHGLSVHGLSVGDVSTPNSALFYGLQSWLFWIGVDGDGGARALAAAAGVVMIVLPWWWRGWLGRYGALAAAWLLALDPWLLGLSRMADGATLALMLGLVALTGVVRMVETRGTELAGGQRIRERITAVAIGLLVVSGPVGWSLLPVVVWAVWLYRDGLAGEDAGVAATLRSRRALAWAAVAALLGATGWLGRMEGLGWVGTGVGVWLAGLDGQAAATMAPSMVGDYDLGWPWLRLWVDLPLTLGLGALGLVWLRRTSPPAPLRGRGETEGRGRAQGALPLLVWGWLTWGALLWLLPGRGPLALPVVSLALMLAAAWATEQMAQRMPRHLDWREAGAVALTLVILLASGSVWLTALFSNSIFDPTLLMAALIIFGLALAILGAFAWWANRTDALWVAGGLALALLLVGQVRGGWRVSFGDVLAEPAGWKAAVGHPELHHLADDIETLSAHRTGDPFEHPIRVALGPYTAGNGRVMPAVPDPMLGWALRGMRKLEWAPAAGSDGSAALTATAGPPAFLITMGGRDQWAADEGDAVGGDAAGGDAAGGRLRMPDGYVGSEYHVEVWWLPRVLEEAQAPMTAPENMGWLGRALGTPVAALRPWWRWWVYRQSAVPPQERDVILWVPMTAGEVGFRTP